MYVIVCYEVVLDRRRNRLLRRLRELLTHVQKSVFEGEIDDGALVRLRSTILVVGGMWLVSSHLPMVSDDGSPTKCPDNEGIETRAVIVGVPSTRYDEVVRQWGH